MVEEVEDDQLEQAYKYWHDLGFDEGYEVGFEDGYVAATESDARGAMGKVAQIKTSDVRCGVYASANLSEVKRMLRDGCPPMVVAANYGLSPRKVRRLMRSL